MRRATMNVQSEDTAVIVNEIIEKPLSAYKQTNIGICRSQANNISFGLPFS